jgi:hypothetical protein
MLKKMSREGREEGEGFFKPLVELDETQNFSPDMMSLESYRPFAFFAGFAFFARHLFIRAFSACVRPVFRLLMVYVTES